MEHETPADHFHDSDSGDVYDLYNACNGVMRGGLLDVRMLDELAPEEREVLDVPRLREVWVHTAAGCLQCVGIIQTLNLARGTIRMNGHQPSQKTAHPSEPSPPGDTKEKTSRQKSIIYFEE